MFTSGHDVCCLTQALDFPLHGQEVQAMSHLLKKTKQIRRTHRFGQILVQYSTYGNSCLHQFDFSKVHDLRRKCHWFCLLVYCFNFKHDTKCSPVIVSIDGRVETDWLRYCGNNVVQSENPSQARSKCMFDQTNSLFQYISNTSNSCKNLKPLSEVL